MKIKLTKFLVNNNFACDYNHARELIKDGKIIYNSVPVDLEWFVVNYHSKIAKIGTFIDIRS